MEGSRAGPEDCRGTGLSPSAFTSAFSGRLEASRSVRLRERRMLLLLLLLMMMMMIMMFGTAWLRLTRSSRVR